MSFNIASPSQKKDLSILGLQPDRFGRLPEGDVIKKAYRSKALLCHPDKIASAPENNNNTAFLELQNAYENLTSPQKLKEEQLKQQFSAASHPTQNGVKNSTFGNDFYTYNVPKTTAYAKTRTPTASSSSRPPFDTKPPSKFGNAAAAAAASSPKTNLSASYSGSNSKLRSSTPAMTSPSSSSSSPSLSSSSRRSSAFAQSHSAAPNGLHHDTSINLLPGAPLIPPPFSNVTREKTTRPSSSSFLRSAAAAAIISPFPAFLVDGKTYFFETDPSAFGIYSNHLKHGDTAKISVPVFQPELGQEVEIIMTGVVIGVAADNNLYWWKVDGGQRDGSVSNLENVATFLAPRIPHTAYHQAHKITVVKQNVPMMSPLNFAASSSCSTSSSTPASPASSTSLASSINNMNHHNNNVSSRSQRNDFNIENFDELMAAEAGKRTRIVKMYEMWLGEAIWCFNLPTFANADAIRFSRLVR